MEVFYQSWLEGVKKTSHAYCVLCTACYNTKKDGRPCVCKVFWCESVLNQVFLRKIDFNVDSLVKLYRIRTHNLEGFPSGQRGQTVNLLAPPSVVRIHHPPPYCGYRILAITSAFQADERSSILLTRSIF